MERTGKHPKSAPTRKRATRKHHGTKHRKITFSLEAANAGEVYLAGEFNNWDPAATPMKKTTEGKWKKQVSLPPGEFEYKFLVDDQWVEDPENEQARSNCFGTWNSLIKIK